MIAYGKFTNIGADQNFYVRDLGETHINGVRHVRGRRSVAYFMIFSGLLMILSWGSLGHYVFQSLASSTGIAKGFFQYFFVISTLSIWGIIGYFFMSISSRTDNIKIEYIDQNVVGCEMMVHKYGKVHFRSKWSSPKRSLNWFLLVPLFQQRVRLSPVNACRLRYARAEITYIYLVINKKQCRCFEKK